MLMNFLMMILYIVIICCYVVTRVNSVVMSLSGLSRDYGSHSQLELTFGLGIVSAELETS